ncbi:acyltransferase family protein [Flammeovirga agarivorans]|uniref:Acyltransferase n=1 Tax=Flammeovirga agarivorans TaxID=2726742 RepID=A0A7X8XYJ3_9BACT|nr:acyltransferase [Flammeovirga agarivorans]NLR94277.1 acyltransferase [Flammeovirga agarivorans]
MKTGLTINTNATNSKNTDPLKVSYLSSLTPLRGIAALWVVLFHIDVSTYYRDLGGILPRAATGIFSKGYLWVDFFFLLSGFIIYHVYGQLFKENGYSIQNIKSFLWSRFTRLYPLHFFTLILLIITVPIIGKTYPQLQDDSWHLYFSNTALFSQFFMTNAMNFYHFLSWNMPSWSIGAEWWTYCFAILVLPIIGHSKRYLIYIKLFVLFGCISLLVNFHPNHNLDITWDYGFIRCIFQFFIGINLYLLFQMNWNNNILQKDITCILLFVFISIGFHYKIHDLVFIPLFSLFLLAVAYNNSSIKSILEKRYIKYLGDISYSIYLMHGLVFFFFWFQFPSWKQNYGWDRLPSNLYLLYIITFLSITVLLSALSHRYIEVGCRNLLRKLK